MKLTFIWLLAVGMTSAGMAGSMEPDAWQISDAPWYQLQDRLRTAGPYGQAGTEIPFIYLAGYHDTDLSFRTGGRLTIMAYVVDSDSDVDRVELFYEGLGTGVYLWDDGLHGDFGDRDDVWALQIQVGPETLPPGDYLLELRAYDTTGNASDLWPYLTIHP